MCELIKLGSFKLSNYPNLINRHITRLISQMSLLFSIANETHLDPLALQGDNLESTGSYEIESLLY